MLNSKVHFLQLEKKSGLWNVKGGSTTWLTTSLPCAPGSFLPPNVGKLAGSGEVFPAALLPQLFQAQNILPHLSLPVKIPPIPKLSLNATPPWPQLPEISPSLEASWLRLVVRTQPPHLHPTLSLSVSKSQPRYFSASGPLSVSKRLWWWS